ncbi:farnesyl diphosphate synthase [Neisseria leonii]|uniref:Farnesyl diphosphate synthase n=1 Tax=Neisseria leonii TaxID=2995413 RepID=A0A9X4E201_9NEIS|nr:farnesyl diphosphate synthase [Neisseria sp. 51.81]MDD9328102.1 polyprenyl synthetase family protein [Neisseria sp. 51.81]
MNTANDFALWQRAVQARTEDALARLMPSENSLPVRLHEAMRYTALGGGKRLRPMLAAAAAELGRADTAALTRVMAAVELIHVYSLVHDDMPAMDNDSLRRGKPTCHVQYGEATALLAGDALQTLAFDILSSGDGEAADTADGARRRLAQVAVLARAAGSLGMAGGQAVDLDHVGLPMTRPELEQMHRLKTGALIRAAVRMGALCCEGLDTAALARLDAYAGQIGLAFQVVDDVLDCEADTATLGKTAGKDADNDKPTYVRLMGLAEAKNYAHHLIDGALAELADFDGRALRLRQLAQFVVARTH